MSERKKKSVQAAEAKKPEQSKPEAEDAHLSGEPQDRLDAVDEQRNEAVHAQIPFDLSKVDPQKVKMAEELGIPVGQLLQWAASVEQRLQLMAREMPQKTAELIIKAANEQRQKQIQEVRENPQSGGSGFGLGDILKLVGGASGGSSEFDDEMRGLYKDLMRVQISKVKGDADFTSSIKAAIVSKIVGKAVQGVADVI